MINVMWFRRDLRLQDNTALNAALQASKQLLLVFHINPEQLISPLSKNQSAFFKRVYQFDQEVTEQGGQLIILYGPLEEAFRRLKEAYPDWRHLYYNIDETGYGALRDRRMKQLLPTLDVKEHAYHDHYLHSAQEIKTQQGTPYKVFTPYYHRWLEYPKPTPVEVSFQADQIIKSTFFEQDDDAFKRMSAAMPSMPTLEVSEKQANMSLQCFVEDHLSTYDRQRDFPSMDGTSRLSHHLRTGTLSIRTVYDTVVRAPYSEGQKTFIKELAWRDFYNMVYASHPHQKNQSIKEAFDLIQWENNPEFFERWKSGQTGFPLIDAAMQQLAQTGWMHNRLRMIVASFLTKDLLIDWRWGEQYFQEALIDYDSANNIGGWQWAASTGTDSVPYFRIFNPVTQSKRYDKEGTFIKQYLPVLKHIPSSKVHFPATLSEKEQTMYQVKLGEDYPLPIIDHQERRKRAIMLYEEAKDISRYHLSKANKDNPK